MAAPVILYYFGFRDGLAVTSISIFALGFSAAAYLSAKERFRLDLYKDRFEIYKEALVFQSIVVKHGGLAPGTTDASIKEILQATQSAENSFTGLGYHKHKFLFGKDIEEYFDGLRADYAWLKNPPTKEGTKQHNEKVLGIYKKMEELPDRFAPYLSFAEYRR